jgi:hypothetical protein
MSITFDNAHTIVSYPWTTFKSMALSKVLSIQYDDDGTVYTIFAYDYPVVYVTNIWHGSVPYAVISGGYSQTQNDSDKLDFETNFKQYANMPIKLPSFINYQDPRLIHKFGQITTTSTSEVLLYPRTYVEPSSQAQRSIVSTSSSDSNALGTGACQIRLTYLDSNYVLYTEDIYTNGTTAVNTVGTNIQFIEDMQVIKGTTAVGAIKLMTGTNGSGTEIAGIGSATTQAFFCHHYIPAGKRAWILGWGVVSNNQTNVKLNGEVIINGNTVPTILDLDNLDNGGLTAPNRIQMSRNLLGVMVSGQTQVNITVVPAQTTSTIIRGYIDIFEDVS